MTDAKSSMPYALTPVEVPALQQFLRLQQLLGVTSPAFTDETIIGLMKQISVVAGDRPGISNALIAGWIDRLYQDLIKADTSYSQKFPALFIAYALAQWPFDPEYEMIEAEWKFDYKGTKCSISFSLNVPRRYSSVKGDPTSYISEPTQIKMSEGTVPIKVAGIYPLFVRPGHLLYDLEVKTTVYWIPVELSQSSVTGSAQRSPWVLPQKPDNWNKAIAGLLETWELKPPESVIPISDFSNYQSNQKSVLSVTHWTDSDDLKTAVSPTRNSQLDTLQVMRKADDLGVEGYFFLCLLLPALSFGDSQKQQSVSELINAPANSPEYPNDTFINQLLYLVLMYLINPEQAFKWDNAKLITFLESLLPLVKGDMPTHVTISQSIQKQLQVLRVDPSYPIVDPYNPGVDFNQRIADTIQALDNALKSTR